MLETRHVSIIILAIQALMQLTQHRIAHIIIMAYLEVVQTFINWLDDYLKFLFEHTLLIQSLKLHLVFKFGFLECLMTID